MTAPVGRTPREGVRELRRRERISEMRRLHRRMGQHHGYARMFAAGFLGNQVLAWTLMTAIGILHVSWWRTVPTMGYGTASIITGLAFLGVVATIMIIQTARDFS